MQPTTADLYDYRGTTAAQVTEIVDRAVIEAEALVVEAEKTADDPGVKTLDLIDAALERLTVADGQAGMLFMVHPDPEVREAAQQGAVKIRDLIEGIAFRPGIQAAIVELARRTEKEPLTGADGALLALWERSVRRAGGMLSPQAQEEANELRRQILEREARFQRNLNERSGGIDLDAAALAGLSPQFVESLGPGTEPGTRRVSIDFSEYQPFMAGSPNRAARETLMRLFWTPPDGNIDLLTEAIGLRARMAKALGYPSWAAYRTETTMAGSPGGVRQMYDDLMPRLKAAIDDEVEALTELLVADGEQPPLQQWDVDYYVARLREQRHNYDAAALAAYLPLDRAWEGLLRLTARVFGVTFRKIDEANAWDESVVLYEVTDAASGGLIGHFYWDAFPRPGKNGNAAWAGVLRPYARRADGSETTPVAALFTNVAQPEDGRPSLLHLDAINGDLVIVFHEFGHVLHFLFMRPGRLGLSSDSALFLDFIEAPSQLFEHWAFDRGVLEDMAHHHATGEPAPPELIDAAISSRWDGSVLATAWFAAVALTDLALHEDTDPVDVRAAERSAYDALPYPHPGAGICTNGVRVHLMGGYDAGMYGYLWAEIIGADLFSRFLEAGASERGVGADYRNLILARPLAYPPSESVREFLGRDPTPDAWLRLHGLGVDSG